MRFAFFILYYFSVCIYPQTKSIVPSTWYEQNHERIISDFKNITVNSETILDTLLAIWDNRDGIIGLEVTEYFIIALIHKPDEILKVFDRHPESYKSWLEDIPHNILTDFGKNVTIIKNEREEIICSLENYKKQNNILGIEAMSNEIINKLRNTKIKEID